MEAQANLRRAARLHALKVYAEGVPNSPRARSGTPSSPRATTPSLARVTVSKYDLTVHEGGMCGYLSIGITAKPLSEVRVAITDTMRQVVCLPSALLFTALDFDKPQVTRVVCIAGNTLDTMFSFLQLEVSSEDSRFAGLTTEPVVVQIIAREPEYAWVFGEGMEGQLGMDGPYPVLEPSQVRVGVHRDLTSTIITPPLVASPTSPDLSIAAALTKTPTVHLASVSAGGALSAVVTAAGDMLTFGTPCAVGLSPDDDRRALAPAPSVGSGTSTAVLTSSPRKPPAGTPGRPVHGTLSKPAPMPCSRYPLRWTGIDSAMKHHPCVTVVACGTKHAGLITDEGLLLTWGIGAHGCLGHGDTSDRPSPTVVAALTGSRVVAVACGGGHTLATTRLALYTWGMASTGALGHADSLIRTDILRPVEVPYMKSAAVFQVAAGAAHSVVLANNGTVWSAGWHDNGRLGRQALDGASQRRFKQVMLPDSQFATSISCGGAHTLVLDDNGQVFAFGLNSHGQLGVGDVLDRWEPQLVTALSDRGICSVAAGMRHSVALSTAGVVYVWGDGDQGQLGFPTVQSNQVLPWPLESLIGLMPSRIAAGMAHTIVLTATTPYEQQRQASVHPEVAAAQANDAARMRAEERAHYKRAEERTRAMQRAKRERATKYGPKRRGPTSRSPRQPLHPSMSINLDDQPSATASDSFDESQAEDGSQLQPSSLPEIALDRQDTEQQVSPRMLDRPGSSFEMGRSASATPRLSPGAHRHSPRVDSPIDTSKQLPFIAEPQQDGSDDSDIGDAGEHSLDLLLADLERAVRQREARHPPQMVNPANRNKFPPPALPQHHVAVRAIMSTFASQTRSPTGMLSPRPAVARFFPQFMSSQAQLEAAETLDAGLLSPRFSSANVVGYGGDAGDTVEEPNRAHSTVPTAIYNRRQHGLSDRASSAPPRRPATSPPRPHPPSTTPDTSDSAAAPRSVRVRTQHVDSTMSIGSTGMLASATDLLAVLSKIAAQRAQSSMSSARSPRSPRPGSTSAGIASRRPRKAPKPTVSEESSTRRPSQTDGAPRDMQLPEWAKQRASPVELEQVYAPQTARAWSPRRSESVPPTIMMRESPRSHFPPRRPAQPLLKSPRPTSGIVLNAASVFENTK